MNKRIRADWWLKALVCLSMMFFSGCLKRASEAMHDEVDMGWVTKIQVGNPVGRVEVRGDVNRADTVHIKIRKQVETYSLFGLADPNDYLDEIGTCPEYDEGVVSLQVVRETPSFFQRLFVRILPRIEYVLDVPATIEADIQVDVGSVMLQDLAGDVETDIQAGELTLHAQLGVFGSQSLTVGVGSMTLTLPSDAAFRYDFNASIGSIESPGFPIAVEPHNLIGARASGAIGMVDTPSMIHGKVNIGNILLHAE